MDDSDILSGDRVAASNLLIHLRVEATQATLDLAARHFAKHRQTAMEWAAQRAQASILDCFEDSSQRYFPHHDEKWSEGFRCAEQQIASMTIRYMLQLDVGKAQTKGQILRRLVRHSRKG